MPAAVPVVLQYGGRRRHRRPGVSRAAAQEKGCGKEGESEVCYFHDEIAPLGFELVNAQRVPKPDAKGQTLI